MVKNAQANTISPLMRKNSGTSTKVTSAANDDFRKVRLTASQLSRANMPMGRWAPSRAPKAVATPFPPRNSKKTGYICPRNKDGQKTLEAISYQRQGGRQFAAQAQNIGCTGIAGSGGTRIWQAHDSANQDCGRQGAKQVGRQGCQQGRKEYG